MRLVGPVAFLVTVAYWPGILNPATTPRWIVLSLCVPACLSLPTLVEPSRNWTAGHLAGGLFLAWAALSLTWTSSPPDGINTLWLLLVLAGVWVIGQSLKSLASIYAWLAAGMAVNGAVAIGQWLEIFPVRSAIFPRMDHVPAGLFYNPNYMAEAAALVLVGLATTRQWRWMPAVLPAIALPHARGAVLALAAAGWLWLWHNRRHWAWMGAAAALAGFGAVLWLLPPDYSLMHRVALWRDTIGGMTWLGHGLGGFMTDFSGHAPHFNLMQSRPTHAHNDLLEFAYELGPGVLPLLALLGFALAGAKGTAGPRPEYYVLAAFLVEASFAFPTHMPVTAFMAAMALGHLCRDRRSVVDELARWRIPVRARLYERRAGASRTTAGYGRPGVPFR